MVSLHLGRADEGVTQILESIVVAERLNKPSIIATALTYACMLYRELREPNKVREFAERPLATAREHQFSPAFASVYLGWASARLGKPSEGIQW